MSITAPDTVPPLPDVMHAIGIDGGDNLLHAVQRHYAAAVIADNGCDSFDTTFGTLCGRANTRLARTWGEFARGNEKIDARNNDLCPHCTWTVALTADPATPPEPGALIALSPIQRELATVMTTGAELNALSRLMPYPQLAGRVCKRILEDRETSEEYDPDCPRWVNHLAAATAHKPVLLVAEECAESSCEHGDDKAGCYRDTNTVACHACSFQAGSWAGEWEGQYEITVPAPCSRLIALAKHYGLEV